MSLLDRIEAEIRRFLSEGIDLAAETEHFIESTFPGDAGERLSAPLSGEDGEAAVLADLLFFPGEEICCRVEALLAPEGLPKEAVDALAARLGKDPPEASFRFPAAGRTFSLALPPDRIEAFVDRLGLSKPVDAALAAAADALSEPQALRVRSRLRGARLAGDGTGRAALVRFLAAAPPEAEDFWGSFDYLVGVLESRKQGADLFSLFAARKGACLRHLQQAAAYQDALKRHNVETLMVRGERAPCVDRAGLTREVLRIDDLCRVLFGKSAPVKPAGCPLDLGEIRSPEDVERLVFLLNEI